MMTIMREKLVAASTAGGLVFTFICGFRWPVVHVVMAGLLVALVVAMVIQFLTDEEEIASRKFREQHSGIMQ